MSARTAFIPEAKVNTIGRRLGKRNRQTDRHLAEELHTLLVGTPRCGVREARICKERATNQDVLADGVRTARRAVPTIHFSRAQTLFGNATCPRNSVSSSQGKTV